MVDSAPKTDERQMWRLRETSDERNGQRFREMVA